MVSLLWKSGWRFLKNKQIQIYPLIHFLVYPKELKARTQTDVGTPAFIAALFTTAKRWKQVCFACCIRWTLRHWGLQQREGLFVRQPGEEIGEQVLSLPPWRPRAPGIYGMKIKQQGGLRVGSPGKGDWGKVQQSSFCAGATKLQAPAGSSHNLREELSALWNQKVSKHKPSTCPGGGSVVLSSLNRLSSNSTQLTPFLENNSDEHLIVYTICCLEDMHLKMTLVSEAGEMGWLITLSFTTEMSISG